MAHLHFAHLPMNDHRVYLREYTTDDYEAFRDWQTDLDVAEYLSWLPVSNEDAHKNLIDAVTQQSEIYRMRYYMAVVLTDSQEVVGNAGITRGKDYTGNIGWFLRQKFWGKGYATEAAKLMIAYGFETIGLKKLVTSCHRDNKASERIMQKCGFHLSDANTDRVYYTLDYDTWSSHLHL